MKLIIDRFEEEYAVLEDDDERRIEVLKSELPLECHEGDVIDLTDGIYTIDREATDERRKRIANLSKRLFTD